MWKTLSSSKRNDRSQVFNLQLPSAVQHFRLRRQQLSNNDAHTEILHVGNTAAEASVERLTASRRAVDSFFSELDGLAAWQPQKVIFVVDAIRPFVYDGRDVESLRTSYFAQMRDYFITKARELGHNAIDLHPLFEKIHRRDGLRFEFVDDGHWNAHGHRIAAQAVARSPVFGSLFGVEPDELARVISAGCEPEASP